MDIQIEQLKNMALELVVNIVIAVLVWYIGSWVIKKIMSLLSKRMEKAGKLDETLRKYVINIGRIVLYVVLAISVIGIMGIETTSFAAILAAAGLAIGLSLQGSLGNFAGGFMIILFKPFKVGDFIEAQGHSGSVSEIQIFNTILKTPDNKTIILPNGPLASGAMVNYSTEPTRRCDLTFGIGYSDDIDKAREIIKELIEQDGRYLKDQGYEIYVAELADSSVNFTVRTWVNGGDYWPFFFHMHEQVKKAFDDKGVSIPFPQMDVHMDKA
jgi:small conductance mechanosensitive channel